MRLAQRSNGARFVSTTQWVRLFPLENTWKRYGRYHGSSGRRPNAATTRMADLTNTGVIRITEAAQIENRLEPRGLGRARGAPRVGHVRGAVNYVRGPCVRIPVRRPQCARKLQSSSHSQLVHCAPQTVPAAWRHRRKSNALYTVPVFFPPSLTHTRHPHKALPSSTAIPNSTRPKYKFASVLPPSFFHLPLRACQSLLGKGAKRATNVEYARRVSPCIFSQFGQVQGLLRSGRLSGITGVVFFLTWRQGRWRWKRSGRDIR
jgi:hypothetical protein